MVFKLIQKMEKCIKYLDNWRIDSISSCCSGKIFHSCGAREKERRGKKKERREGKEEGKKRKGKREFSININPCLVY